MSETQHNGAKERAADRWIDLATLMRIRSLELRARHVVQGFWSGLHRSRQLGFSVEFAEYRGYVPGDELRRIDWKLFGRTDRLFVKQYADETNLSATLVLDASGSMNYGSGPFTKWDYAATLTATLAYFLLGQRDAVGIATISGTAIDRLVPRCRAGQLRHLLAMIEKTPAQGVTSFPAAMETLVPQLRRKGLVVLIGDLLLSPDELATRMRMLASSGQDIMVFGVHDPAELEFPFEESAWFEDSETLARISVDPRLVRAEYLNRFAAHRKSCQQACDSTGASLTWLRTDQPLDEALSAVLQRRIALTSQALVRGVRA